MEPDFFLSHFGFLLVHSSWNVYFYVKNWKTTKWRYKVLSWQQRHVTWSDLGGKSEGITIASQRATWLFFHLSSFYFLAEIRLWLYMKYREPDGLQVELLCLQLCRRFVENPCMGAFAVVFCMFCNMFWMGAGQSNTCTHTVTQPCRMFLMLK